MNTQSTKKSIKLNFFDILLIIFAVLVVAAAAAIFVYSGSHSTDRQTIEYTVLVKELPNELQIHAEPGQTVVDTIKLGTIGEYVSHEIKEAAYDEFDFVNEENVHGEYEDMYSAAFTFRADVEKTDASYLINNVRISVGAEVHFRTPYFVGFGYVTDVTEIPAE